MLARACGFTDADGRTPDFATSLTRYRETSAQPVQP